MKPLLFEPLKIRDLTFKNRIFVSPMCQYSGTDGIPNDWHLVHLGTRAVGGASLVMVEATGIEAIGRISDKDLGLWNETQEKAFKPIVNFIKKQGAIAGIQLAHAGRKASSPAPWEKDYDTSRNWEPVGPSAIAFSHRYQTPHELKISEIKHLTDLFVESTKRALRCGFEVIELHMAHGYLLHEFLSPLSNQRTDQYAGSFENRIRFPLDVAKAVRAAIPQNLPLFVRISATDWTEGGWDIDQSVLFVKELQKLGIDFIDTSTGGNVHNAKIPLKPHYQVEFAKAIKEQTGVLTGAVGLITEAKAANGILENNEADAILLARELLRHPYWPLEAAKILGVEAEVPEQYERAF